MIRLPPRFLTFLIAGVSTACAESETSKSTFTNIDIFSSYSVECIGLEAKSACFPATGTVKQKLSYPVCNGGSLKISFFECPAGCYDGKCELVYDTNKDGLYDREEILAVVEAFRRGDIDRNIYISIIRHWKMQ